MTVIALGTFDGVHLGHQKIIKATVAYAKKHGLTPMAITFDPHPQQVVAPGRGLKLLTTLNERRELLHEYGIKKVYVIKFTGAFRKMGPEKFIEKILIKKLKAKHVFVGYDFAFGMGRLGGGEQLKGHGFSVTVVPAAKKNGEPIKSSGIREDIRSGNFNNAVKQLGHSYQITGRVVYGAGIGKGLGFPTINLKTDPHKLIPSQGVYAGRCQNFKAAINIGKIVEAHLIGFDKKIYGHRVTLRLERKIREEKKFPDIEKLKAQITKDVAKTKFIVL